MMNKYHPVPSFFRGLWTLGKEMGRGVRETLWVWNRKRYAGRIPRKDDNGTR